MKQHRIRLILPAYCQRGNALVFTLRCETQDSSEASVEHQHELSRSRVGERWELLDETQLSQVDFEIEAEFCRRCGS
jgi:hypothetical protein